MDNFNFFRVLEKDNKELIHSAFISYLFSCNDLFRDKLLNVSNVEFSKPQLERSYNIRKRLKGRIDIEIISTDEKHIILIENKFKSFPDKIQLDNYNKMFKKTYANDITIYKYIFCFDKKTIKFETDWKILDYNDLLEFIGANFKINDASDQSVFIKHYYSFLGDYIKDYKLYMSDSKNLFTENITNDNAKKFWLKLVYSNLHLRFINHFNDEVTISVSPGTSTIPFLDIFPKKWKINKQELLIQLQGNDLKLYTYSNDKILIDKVINLAKKSIRGAKFDTKKVINRDAKSSFILKTKISDNINMNKELDIDSLFLILKDFYDYIDLEIINNSELNPAFTQ